MGSTLAAVIVDPVQLSLSDASSSVKMKNLVQAVHDAGAVLIFDESKTGFRVHLSGVQGLLGVAADLTVLSKALANGLPLAVVLGRTEVLNLARPARVKGTFGAETASIAAALATLHVLRDKDAPRSLNERGTQLLNGLNDAIRAVGVAERVTAVPYHWPCLPYIYFRGEARSLENAFHDGLVRRGVLMLRDHMSYISLALMPEHVDRVVTAAHQTLRELI
jgi:glutamate-1-semialdehyde aminotransferase